MDVSLVSSPQVRVHVIADLAQCAGLKVLPSMVM